MHRFESLGWALTQTSRPGPLSFIMPLFFAHLLADGAAENNGEATEEQTQSAAAAPDADAAPRRDTNPQRAVIAASAVGAASSTHAAGRAVAISPAVTSAPAQPADSGPAASAPVQLDGSAAPSVVHADGGAVSLRGGTPAVSGAGLLDGCEQASMDQQAAQEQREAAPPPQHAADGHPVGPSPTSVVGERGSSPAALPATLADSHEPVPMFSASGPATEEAERRQAVTADATNAAGRAEAPEAEATAGSLRLPTVPQEASASRGTSPGPEPANVPAGLRSESTGGSAGDAPAASSARDVAAGAAMKRPAPPEAGDGSASDTWESPDLPPHLAKLGLRSNTIVTWLLLRL